MAAADPSNNPGVKVLVETSDLKSIPSEFIFQNDSKGSHSDSIPTVDFSDLTSDDPHRRSQALAELARACQEWGFFVLINHGVPERLMKGIIDASLEFFELPEEEKSRYASKSASDPIKAGSGTVFTTSDQKIHLWRDFVKSYVHPEFHCPDKPQSLRETVGDYTERTRSILRTLMKAISENLGLEEGYTDEALKLDSCFQQYTANYYQPCPHPDQAIGLPPHTDHGLLTFLIHNGVAGLHIQHSGVWFDFDSPQNSILVNTGDHLQVQIAKIRAKMHTWKVEEAQDLIGPKLEENGLKKRSTRPTTRLVGSSGITQIKTRVGSSETITAFSLDRPLDRSGRVESHGSRLEWARVKPSPLFHSIVHSTKYLTGGSSPPLTRLQTRLKLEGS